MPFKNCQQQKAMFAKDPELARQWVRKYGNVCGKSESDMKAKNDRIRRKHKQ